jgi:hypothetical protein
MVMIFAGAFTGVQVRILSWALPKTESPAFQRDAGFFLMNGFPAGDLPIIEQHNLKSPQTAVFMCFKSFGKEVRTCTPKKICIQKFSTDHISKKW